MSYALDTNSTGIKSTQINRPKSATGPITLPKKSPLPSAMKNSTPDIQVIVRKRPLSTKEGNRGEMDVVECSGASVLVHEPKYLNIILLFIYFINF